MSRTLFAVSLGIGAVLAAAPARAVGSLGVGTPIEGPPPGTTGIEPGNKRAYWARGVHRLFASSIVDVGYLYVRPEIAVGWGKPHWHYVEIEAFGTIAGGGIGQYGGVRLALPHVELRSGARYQFAFDRFLFARRESYDRFSIESRATDLKSRYTSLEAELVGTVPIGTGSLFAIASAFVIRGVPEDYDLYEEQLRVVMRPPTIFRGRLGYTFRLGREGALRLGPVGEVVHVPARPATVVRAGLIATVVLNDFLEALGTFVPVVASPDQIGLAGGDFGQLGLRFRWGTPRPPPDALPPAPPPFAEPALSGTAP